MVRDTIADLLTSIKNAGAVGKELVSFPYSKFHLAVAEVLLREGYLASVAKRGKKMNKAIEIKLAFNEAGKPKVKGVRRISRLSRRVYYKVSDIRPVRYGAGTLVLSTTKGILSGKEARRLRLGGEALFEIW